jgi:two-component system, OmpR family, sensor histidine kinase QseC
LALPILAVALWWAVRRGLLPLRELSHTLALRQPHTLEPLAQAEMPTEMLPMIQALNDLFERIAHMIASERRFTADAAHELRTPIAAIRAQAQVAQGAGSDVAQREHALQATLAGCDRATRLVEQLLTLARLEATSPTAMPAALEATAPRVDLSSITRHVAADLVPTALARQHTLELEAEAPCPIAANDMLTAVLVRNLVDNAIRYSPNGARIRVCVLHEAAQSTLLVEDSGTAMTALEMARLGERFFRVLGGGESGSGLGWSIVKRIADVSHAQVQVSRSALLGGLAVQVVWPTPLKSVLLQTLPP